jgi:hypothetical protein
MGQGRDKHANGTNRRYEYIEPMYSKGNIRVFSDIFKFIPYTVVARDLGYRSDRFKEQLTRLDEFTLKKLFAVARICGITEQQVVALVLVEWKLGRDENSETL